MLPEKLGNFGLAHLSLSHRKNDWLELHVLGSEGKAIEFQKAEGRHCTSTFVSIDERMVLNDMEEVGGCHFEEIGMQVLISKPRLGHGDSRFQQL